MSKKYDAGFQKMLLEQGILDEATGDIRFKNLYASTYLNIGWKGGVVSVPYSHVVWFLKHKRWPQEGLYIDHVNNDPMDNRPCNLREVTHEENMAKRRGRIVNRNYGTGKHGPGIGIYNDKRDGRFYVTHTQSRGHHGQMKTVKKSLGGFDTLEQAKDRIRQFLKENRL